MKLKVTQHRRLNRAVYFTAGLYPTNEVELEPGNSILNRTGATKEQALMQLERSITGNARHGSYRKYLRGNTTTWCLSYNDGWQYDIVRDGQSTFCSILLSVKTCTEAIEAMQTHFSQHEDDQPIADQIADLATQ